MTAAEVQGGGGEGATGGLRSLDQHLPPPQAGPQGWDLQDVPPRYVFDDNIQTEPNSQS
eukprot:COSAG01_NODE_6466_length_3651_cov_2.861486_1_plen_59_part_00